MFLKRSSAQFLAIFLVMAIVLSLMAYVALNGESPTIGLSGSNAKDYTLLITSEQIRYSTSTAAGHLIVFGCEPDPSGGSNFFGWVDDGFDSVKHLFTGADNKLHDDGPCTAQTIHDKAPSLRDRFVELGEDANDLIRRMQTAFSLKF